MAVDRSLPNSPRPIEQTDLRSADLTAITEGVFPRRAGHAEFLVDLFMIFTEPGAAVFPNKPVPTRAVSLTEQIDTTSAGRKMIFRMRHSVMFPDIDNVVRHL
jgi:hypothetical protein